MKCGWIRVVLALVLAGCDPGMPSAGAPVDSAPGSAPAAQTVRAVRVFAASSLREVCGDVAAAWLEHGGRACRVQFEASSTLARQIQEGAEADVFVSAAPEWLDPLSPSARFDWLSNRLVCAVRKEVADFRLAGVDSLALASEQVPAGKYAKAALAHLGIALPARVVYGANVRDVLSKVSQGGAAAGIVYATDVPIDPDLEIAFEFPADSHPPIVYSVGVLTEDGKAFADALRTDWARAAARRRGFRE